MAQLRRSPLPSLALAVSLLAATASPAAAAQPRDPVKRTVERAFARGTIDAGQRNGYLSSYTAALRTERHLSGVRRAELGYVIGERDQWGKGFATEAIALATSYAFLELALQKVWASVVAPNEASRRALERNGYRQCAVFRRDQDTVTLTVADVGVVARAMGPGSRRPAT